MSQWTDQWRDFVKETSYVHSLMEEKISNDQFWKSYEIYDQALMYSGYPGEILNKISSYISPGSTLLDIGAGTGAFAIPLSFLASQVIAVDPSAYQLQILLNKAREKGLTNIVTVEKEWKDVQQSDIYELVGGVINRSGNSSGGICNDSIRGSDGDGRPDNQEVDYSLAAYSLFEDHIEAFLAKMIGITRKGIFIVFRAGSPDSLNEFAFGPGPQADYLCLYNILKDMGYQFDVILFSRDYNLPLEVVFKQYRFSKRSRDELARHLQAEGRLQEKEDGRWAAFSTKDAMLYLIL